jgi:serine/alanine adding enzyme
VTRAAETPASLRSERDPAAWDSLVRDHPHGHVLQSWAWGEIKRDHGWRPARVVASDGSNRAAAQLLLRPVYGLSVAYVPRGPLLSGSAQLDRELIRGLRRFARSKRAVFLRLEPNLRQDEEEGATFASLLAAEGFRTADAMQPRSTVQLDLSQGLEQLHAGISKGHRADIRRAERNGVEVRQSRDPADLDAFYRLLEATARRKEFGIHARGYYDTVLTALGDRASLLLAEHDGQVVAASFILGWGREAQYMYSASSDAGFKLRASHLIQWRAIQWAASMGCRRYDLWGIPDVAVTDTATPEQVEQAMAAHPLSGVYRFKRGWGGSIVRLLPAFDAVNLWPAYLVWQRLRRTTV